MYIMVCTRPDIAQAVGVVSRFMHDPGRSHWQAVKSILTYLKGTIDVVLVFERHVYVVDLCAGYTNSDYAGDIDRHRYIIGYVFTLVEGPVSW
ncbi:Retrovirus-related Pol polyprotein from transposon TNT 1-94 [Dendrobium catenatum]|uniref:Retrovirus-related Pol polyprotein from transposon TNT 1-94 n=1 Tax=Dendrobium catenatum TaxID=906689 RepID=A0A2I0VCK0_9ASPA|nr:Retrovirus-related Pol polyprotein from transposon TNT 1-94 [Dendrobium catenatum]